LAVSQRFDSVNAFPTIQAIANDNVFAKERLKPETVAEKSIH
jgi:hypothetical protein